MISINECLMETVCTEKNPSCTNELIVKNDPAVVYTNKTSFVGVQAVVEPNCNFKDHPILECFNGGSPIEDTHCICADGFEGPNCEILGIGFRGDGWAMYRSFPAHSDTEIRLEVLAERENGLIFYVGPMNSEPIPPVRGKC